MSSSSTDSLLCRRMAVRGAINRVAERLAKAGAELARSSDLLPDLADSARIFMRLLGAARSGAQRRNFMEK